MKKKRPAPRRRTLPKRKERGKEMAIVHPDGSYTDLELWEDILTEEELVVLRPLARKPPTP